MNSVISVFFTLLFLYAIPLIMLSISMLTPGAESFHSFVVSVLEVYVTPVRDALASFVMPFAAAFAISTISKRSKIGHQSSIIFYSIVLLIIVALIGSAYMNRHGQDFIQRYATGHGVDGVDKAVLGLCSLYLKEGVAYLSLIIGIGGAQVANPRRTSDNEPSAEGA